MTAEAKKLLDEALALPEADREMLIEALSQSLDPDHVQLSGEWVAELRRRISDVEDGSVALVPWDEVEARIKRSLGQE